MWQLVFVGRAHPLISAQCYKPLLLFFIMHILALQINSCIHMFRIWAKKAHHLRCWSSRECDNMRHACRQWSPCWASKRFLSHLEYLLSWQTYLHKFFLFRNIWGTFRATIHQKYHAFSSHITFPINVSTGYCWSMLVQFLLAQCCLFIFLSFYGAYVTFAKIFFYSYV